MAKITFKGNEVNTNGTLPAVGAEAPDFKGVKSDLTELSLKELKGKNVVINVFPSLDTTVCAASVRRFNKEAASLPNTVVLAVSKDLPFAHGRFCTTEGIDKVITLSAFRCSYFRASNTRSPTRSISAFRALLRQKPRHFSSSRYSATQSEA